MILALKKELLEILTLTINVLESRVDRDIFELKELSNRAIKLTALYQDEDSMSIAVLIYSIFKILERMTIIDKKYYSSIILYLKNAIEFMKQSDRKRYSSEIKAIFKLIDKIDARLRIFVEEVVNKARITKGSKLVENGVSIAKAASLMGISQWELMSYVGKTEFMDLNPFKEDVKRRLNFARKLFK